MEMADKRKIVTCKILEHHSDWGFPTSTADQRQTKDTGRNVLPSTLHWSALSLPWFGDPKLVGTEVSHEGNVILAISEQIWFISSWVKTWPHFVDVAKWPRGSLSFSICCWHWKWTLANDYWKKCILTYPDQYPLSIIRAVQCLFTQINRHRSTLKLLA